MTLTKKILLSGALVLALVLSGRTYDTWHCSSDKSLSLSFGTQVVFAEVEKLKYTCPMHPAIIQDEPGDCPICGMKLIPVKPDSTGVDESQAAKHLNTCPMHPAVIQNEPGNCPICGMKLTPVKPDATGVDESQGAKPPNKTSDSPHEDRK
ncbi:MAG: hypothetical protein KKD63_08890 [Proteobacteria bacterium]|nr:hypothetical protein [Desulfobulbaceae bacterium]MBU4152984.1 hypothetical protein [Pseudomonadota bacterium]